MTRETGKTAPATAGGWTAGPWRYERADDHHGFDVIAGGKAGTHAPCLALASTGNSKANARLIAAAPELAAMLQRFIYMSPVLERDCLMSDARALLARIAGREG